MAKILGIGVACLDHLNVLDDYPLEDETGHILQIETQGGGQVATALVACARLGHTCTYMGTLGHDGIGQEIIDGLKQEKIECVIEYKDVVSPHSEIMIQPEHSSRTKFVFLNTAPNLSYTKEQIEQIKKADALHLDNTFVENTEKAIALAKEYGVLTCLDAEARHADKQRDIDLACSVDILIMSKRFALATTGLDDPIKALEFFGPKGPKVVIVTCGADGCYLYRNGKAEHFPAYKVKAIDTTGAGDVFHGAFLSAYLNKYDLDTCIKYASYVAGQKCTKIGGRTGIPYEVDLNNL